MAVVPKLEDRKILRLREAMMTGTGEGLNIDVTKNIDNKAIFIEFTDPDTDERYPRVVFNVYDMIEAAYEKLVEEGHISRKGGRRCG